MVGLLCPRNGSQYSLSIQGNGAAGDRLFYPQKRQGNTVGQHVLVQQPNYPCVWWRAHAFLWEVGEDQLGRRYQTSLCTFPGVADSFACQVMHIGKRASPKWLHPMAGCCVTRLLYEEKVREGRWPWIQLDQPLQVLPCLKPTENHGEQESGLATQAMGLGLC